MESSVEAPAVRPEDAPKPTTDAPESAPAPSADVMDQNTQSAAANRSLKELSLDSFSGPSVTTTTSENLVAAATNGINGVNGSKSPAADANGSVTEPAPVVTATETITTIAAADDGDTVMNVEYSETRPEAAASDDPVVQQPTSDLRGPPEPVSEEQVSDIKEAKQLSDLASDRELATGIAQDSTAPIERSITPAAGAPTGDAMEITTTTTTVEVPTPDTTLPLHPPVPAAETSVEPAPTPSETLEPKSTPTLPPPAQDKDTAMTDVPTSPGKVARGRDEEDIEEPATKRLKAVDGDKEAEFKIPEAPAAAPEQAGAESQASESAAIAGSVSSRVRNEEHEKPITPAQKKYVQQKVFNGLKRAKYAANFKAPVDPVLQNIPTYPDIIKNPMDLRTMEEKLKADEYANVSDIWDDFNLIVENCVTFNGPSHNVTKAAYSLRDAFDKYMAQVPSADFVEPTAADKKAKRASIEKPPSRRRESRSGDKTKSPVAQSPGTFALQPTGVPTIRRDSTIADGRPRREIHPPAPKDLPYSNQRPRKKKFQWELKWCQDVLNDLKKSSCAWPFLTPVDPVALNIPQYHKIIKKPMDISSIDGKLKAGEYENAKEFEGDVKLMFNNCFKFNPPDDNIHKIGKQLEAVYDERAEGRKEWIKEHAPSNAQSPGSSPEASDAEDEDEEDEEEEEEEEEGGAAVLQIKEMEKQLELLKRQVSAGQKKKTPPVKGKKAAKQSGKAPKKEATGGAKKSKGGKSDKKPGKSKKKDDKPVRYVTYEQKQDISARINNLPENRMVTALNIIRSNMPNLQGVQDDEIELDIDELSDKVLLQLHDFVRRYAPLPDDEPVARPAPAPAASNSRPKKAKPMGKHEQEARIQELKAKLNGAGDEDSDAGGQAVESSDDDDSEESEED